MSKNCNLLNYMHCVVQNNILITSVVSITTFRFIKEIEYNALFILQKRPLLILSTYAYQICQKPLEEMHRNFYPYMPACLMNANTFYLKTCFG